MTVKNSDIIEKCLIPLYIRNKNGRIYTKENIEPCVEELQKRINLLGCVYGEFEHPDSMDTSLSRCSHLIEKIWFEDNKLMGRVRILNTYWGKQVKELIKDKIEFSVRPRSMGLVDDDGTVRLKKIFTFDIILQHEDAFYSIKDLRKTKLDRLAKLQDDEYLTESIDKMPKLGKDFHVLKNDVILND